MEDTNIDQTAQANTKAEGQKAADDTTPDNSTGKEPSAEGQTPQGDIPVVPEKYELQVPKDALLDQTDMDRITAEAKGLGLSNEQAQELVNVEAEVQANYKAKQLKQVEAIRTSWVKEAETDTEIGGDKFKENTELAKRVVDKFGSDAFKKALNETGFGNHPEIIRTFVRIGKMMGNDSFIMPKSQSGAGKKKMEDVFYGSET